MSSLRDRAVATLSVSIKELGGYDSVMRDRPHAINALRAAVDVLRDVRDEYTKKSGPLPPHEAEELRHVSRHLEQLGSGTEAADALQHESDRIHHFLIETTRSVDGRMFFPDEQ